MTQPSTLEEISRRILTARMHRVAVIVASLGAASVSIGAPVDASAVEVHDAALARAGFSPLVPTTVEFRWHLRVPEWKLRWRTASQRVRAPGWGVQRVDYSMPGIRTERRRIASVPEFECKYNDFGLPNECRTSWRGLYVDIPVAVSRHDYFEIDVPKWSVQDWEVPVEALTLVWKDETLIVSLPAYAVAGEPRHDCTAESRTTSREGAAPPSIRPACAGH